jgi:hypothetical protein
VRLAIEMIGGLAHADMFQFVKESRLNQLRGEILTMAPSAQVFTGLARPEPASPL